jgi:PAS domain S-box-containing protein
MMLDSMPPVSASPPPEPADETLRLLARGVSAATGEAFFHSLAEALAGALGVDHVLIGEVTAPGEDRVRTVAVWAHGRRADNFEYALAGTPCEDLIKRRLCSHPRGVRQLFPNDPSLGELGVESYVGTPLCSSTGQVLGLMAVLDRRPIDDPNRVEALLQIFAHRAAAEMERVQAIEALRRSEERFRALVEKSADGITLLSADGVVTYASPSSARMLGYRPEELVGRSWTEFAHRDELARLRALMSEALLSPEKDVLLNGRVRHKDGSWRHLEANCRNRLDDPSVAAIVINYRDVTDRKRTEESLRESEEDYRLVVQNIDEVIWCVRIADDPQRGQLVLMTDQVAGMTGYRAEDFLHDPDLWASLVHPDDEAVLSQSIRELAAGRGAVTRAYRLRHRETGQYRWLEDRLVPQTDAQGKLVGIFGVGRDITERRQAEEALREGERRFRGLFESSPDAIFVEDLDGNVLDVNPAACRLHGMGRDELLGRHVLELVPEPERERVRADFERLTRGEVERVRGFSRTHDGRAIPVELTTRRISYSGRPALLLHVRDLTERERLEEQARQAQKMEAVGRLAGGVAHDFNNLLTGICGYGELLLRGLPPDDPVREGLQLIIRASERAAGLTRQLLAFSRRQVLQPRVLDLNAVVAGMEEALRRVVGEAVRLRLRLGTGLRAVQVDPGQLEQVIVNLALNARDAMPQGGTLTLETRSAELTEAFTHTRPEVRPGPYSVLAVGDTGRGMAEEVLSHIFEPFFTTKAAGKGTGLGLATVYGVVKQSGGHVEVASTPGQGSVFEVYLPAVPECPARAEAAEAPAEMPRGTETVLLVEDEDTVRAYVATILRQHGYTVLEACDSAEALEVCERHPGVIQLLLTDVVLPDLNGRELAGRLLALRPRLKVLAMSGYANEMVFERGTRNVGMAYLQKPFTSAALLGKVRQVLDG